MKELDLVKFINRIKLLVMSSLGSMTPDQRVVADHMSKVVVSTNGFQDSNTDFSSSGDDKGTFKHSQELHRSLNRLQSS